MNAFTGAVSAVLEIFGIAKKLSNVPGEGWAAVSVRTERREYFEEEDVSMGDVVS